MHELEKYLAATKVKHARVLSSLECVQAAITKVATLGEKVNRERLMLEEKSTVSSPLHLTWAPIRALCGATYIGLHKAALSDRARRGHFEGTHKTAGPTDGKDSPPKQGELSHPIHEDGQQWGGGRGRFRA